MVATGDPANPSTELAESPDHEEAEVSTRFRQWSDKPKFDANDLSYPKLRLAQGTTPEVQQGNATAGDYVLQGYAPVKSVTFIPLMYGKARELKDKDDNRKVLCMSKDSVTGEGTPGGLCEPCPMSQWGGDKDHRKPPLCNLIFSYVGWSKEHESVVIMEFKKTSKGIANFLNVNIQNKGFGNFAVNLTSQSQQNASKQIFYVPIVTFAALEDSLAKQAQRALNP